MPLFFEGKRNEALENGPIRLASMMVNVKAGLLDVPVAHLNKTLNKRVNCNYKGPLGHNNGR